jgi:hypothetical protein
MMKTPALSIAVAALLATLGIVQASAQQPVEPEKTQELKKTDPMPPATGTSKPEQAGTAEPSTKGPGTGPSIGVLVNGRLSVPGAPTDSQTVPSTVSPRNSALDELPIDAFRLHFLTDAQRAEIWQQLHGRSGALALTPAHAAVGALIPADTAKGLKPTPDGLAAQLPELRGTSYLVEGSTVLLVTSSNNIVIGVLAAP